MGINQVDKLAKEKRNMESKIDAAISEILADFKKATGLSVSHIDLTFTNVREMGGTGKSYFLDYIETTINL